MNRKMETHVFEKQVITQLKNLNNIIYEMREDLAIVKNTFEDHFLSEEDKKAIDRALKEEKKGKLVSKAKVFD